MFDPAEYFERMKKEASMFNIEKFLKLESGDIIQIGKFNDTELNMFGGKNVDYKWEARKTTYDWVIYIDYDKDDISFENANMNYCLIVPKEFAQKLMNATDEVMKHYVKESKNET
jgi:hypothetical protein